MAVLCPWLEVMDSLLICNALAVFDSVDSVVCSHRHQLPQLLSGRSQQTSPAEVPPAATCMPPTSQLGVLGLCCVLQCCKQPSAFPHVGAPPASAPVEFGGRASATGLMSAKSSASCIFLFLTGTAVTIHHVLGPVPGIGVMAKGPQGAVRGWSVRSTTFPTTKIAHAACHDPTTTTPRPARTSVGPGPQGLTELSSAHSACATAVHRVAPVPPEQQWSRIAPALQWWTRCGIYAGVGRPWRIILGSRKMLSATGRPSTSAHRSCR
jgi:hypothetical protein